VAARGFRPLGEQGGDGLVESSRLLPMVQRQRQRGGVDTRTGVGASCSKHSEIKLEGLAQVGLVPGLFGTRFVRGCQIARCLFVAMALPPPLIEELDGFVAAARRLGSARRRSWRARSPLGSALLRTFGA
jgi:hypothetical protein